MVEKALMPRIERPHQNAPEWHRLRIQGIGASDAPVIMGETPFKTAKTLWALKTGRLREEPAGPAARRGRELESFARRAYERQTRTQMEPLCLVHQEFEWMRASLDGLSFDGSTLLEIKCPLSLWDRVSAEQGRIPSQYHAQLQHQLEVSGAERAHYWSFSGTDAALRYREARLRLERAAFEQHQLRARLNAMATAKRTYGCGVEVLKSSRKGAVDYSAVPELRGVNLEPYRKPTVAVVKINFNEPNRQ
jgi:putative phage-type endonuclease